MSRNPLKSQRKKPKSKWPCKETRKRLYITKGNVFLPGLNFQRKEQVMHNDWVMSTDPDQ